MSGHTYPKTETKEPTEQKCRKVRESGKEAVIKLVKMIPINNVVVGQMIPALVAQTPMRKLRKRKGRA